MFGDELDSTVRYFPDRLPIGLDPDGRGHVFLYLVTRSVPIDFRAFLQRHAELLRALPSWTIRLVVPSHLATSARRVHNRLPSGTGVAAAPFRCG